MDSSTPVNLCRGDPFHLGVRNPAGTDRPTLTRVVDNGFGGNAVPHGELAGVPVLQVGNAFVPVVAFQAPQVRPGDERPVAVDVQLGLEYEGFITEVVGLRWAAIDQKHRDRARARWQAALCGVRQHRTDGDGDHQAARGWDGVLGRLRRLLREVDEHLFFSRRTCPHKRSGFTCLSRAGGIVAPAHEDS